MQQKRSAQDLAQVVANAIGRTDVRVEVHPDPVYGWHAVAYGSDPNVVHWTQTRIEQLLPDLRAIYALET